MSRYNATDDPLCYPGTQVLKNKAGLRDQDELDQFEQLMYLTRAEEPLPTGNLDFEHYKRIHYHFFSRMCMTGPVNPAKSGLGKVETGFAFPSILMAA